MVKWLKKRLVFYIALTFIILLIIIMTVLYLIIKHSFYSDAKKNAFSITNSIYIALDENIFNSAELVTFLGNDPFISGIFFQNEKDINIINHYLSNINAIYTYDTAYIASFNTNSYYSKSGIAKAFSIDNENDSWFFEIRNNADPSHPYQTFMSTDESGTLYLNHIYLITDNDKPLGFAQVIVDYKAALKPISNILEKFNAFVYIVNSEGIIKSSLFNNTPINQYISDILPVNTKDIISNNHSGFAQITKNNLSISYTYLSKFDSYMVVSQYLSTDILNTFIITFLVVILILSIIVLIVIRFLHYSKTKILHDASLDTLTQTLNRNAFNKMLSESLELCAHYRITSSLIFIDIDNFKTINDEMGHDVGDSIIKKVSQLLNETKRKDDTLFRWGGDEFAIIARCNLNDSLGLSNRILENVRNIYWKDNHHVTLSIGISQIHPNDTKKDIFKRADEALYMSKKSGKDGISYK